jgi:SAM-dependent methyltransferase
MHRSLRSLLARLAELPATVTRVRALRLYVGKPNQKVREYVGRLYLRGHGLEIGALQCPLSLPAAASALYVDRMPAEELARHYGDLNVSGVRPPDIVDDGERLATIDHASRDFVVANHFLEHCEDPIAALENMLRVVKPGGVVFLAVPDKRFTFDAPRPVTTIDHLKRDHAEGPARSRREHFEEWARIVVGASDEDAQQVATELIEADYSIHYHVWTQTELLEFLVTLQHDYGFPFDVELFMRNDLECIIVLRKTGG